MRFSPHQIIFDIICVISAGHKPSWFYYHSSGEKPIARQIGYESVARVDFSYPLPVFRYRTFPGWRTALVFGVLIAHHPKLLFNPVVQPFVVIKVNAPILGHDYFSHEPGFAVRCRPAIQVSSHSGSPCRRTQAQPNGADFVESICGRRKCRRFSASRAITP